MIVDIDIIIEYVSIEYMDSYQSKHATKVLRLPNSV